MAAGMGMRRTRRADSRRHPGGEGRLTPAVGPPGTTGPYVDGDLGFRCVVRGDSREPDRGRVCLITASVADLELLPLPTRDTELATELFRPALFGI